MGLVFTSAIELWWGSNFIILAYFITYSSQWHKPSKTTHDLQNRSHVHQSLVRVPLHCDLSPVFTYSSGHPTFSQFPEQSLISHICKLVNPVAFSRNALPLTSGNLKAYSFLRFNSRTACIRLHQAYVNGYSQYCIVDIWVPVWSPNKSFLSKRTGSTWCS